MTVELELRGITKRFPGVLACDSIDLTVQAGQIHCIVGENGAGKTTLMSILYGLLQPDEGEIVVRGTSRRIGSPVEAIELGLGMVHQAFKLFPSLTVAENLVFGQEPARLGFVDRRRAAGRVRELADAYGLAVDPEAVVEELPVGVLQRVEILKALYRDASILILDEPTAVLTPQERDRLFEVMRRLRDSGRTILFITHKLAEVMAVADHITVLRQGKTVAELDPRATGPAEISRVMTGREVASTRRSVATAPGDAVLSVRGLVVEGVHGLAAVDGVSFEVRAGEVVGVAAVAGNGQSELIEAIAGLRPIREGSVRLAGIDVTGSSVAARRRTGLSYIPEDRHRVGTVAAASITKNLLMGYQRLASFRRGAAGSRTDGRPNPLAHFEQPARVGRTEQEPASAGASWVRTRPHWQTLLLDLAAVDRHAAELCRNYSIRVADPTVAAGTLSGGNLQRVVLAREMSHGSPLLIAEQPTRGVDIGAIEFIHAEIIAARDRGQAVLLVSAELSEILALCSRILVMYEGRVVAELDPDTTDEAEIGFHMTGGASASA